MQGFFLDTSVHLLPPTSVVTSAKMTETEMFVFSLYKFNKPHLTDE